MRYGGSAAMLRIGVGAFASRQTRNNAFPPNHQVRFWCFLFFPKGARPFGGLANPPRATFPFSAGKSSSLNLVFFVFPEGHAGVWHASQQKPSPSWERLGEGGPHSRSGRSPKARSNLRKSFSSFLVFFYFPEGACARSGGIGIPREPPIRPALDPSPAGPTRGRSMNHEIGAPGETRTPDLRFRKPKPVAPSSKGCSQISRNIRDLVESASVGSSCQIVTLAQIMTQARAPYPPYIGTHQSESRIRIGRKFAPRAPAQPHSSQLDMLSEKLRGPR